MGSVRDVVMGLDIGSATSKCVLLRGGKVLAGEVANHGAGTSGPARVLARALDQAGIGRDDIVQAVATGYGRDTAPDVNATRSELSCHARAAYFLHPDARTVIDIGGQDAKVIRLDEKGRMQDFVMNDKCAAGTGRFLDVMARVLELDVSELAAVGARATGHLEISSTCTVFAESEVVSHLAAARPIDDIVAGIHRSVASRVTGLARRVQVVPAVLMTGGVAHNLGVVKALEEALGVPIQVADMPQLAGALGAALYANEIMEEGNP